MTKRGVQPETDDWAATARPGRAPRRPRRWSPVAIGLVVALVAYLLLCFLMLGPERPAVVQRLLALVFVGLSVAVYVVATRPLESPEDALLRLRRGRHADFGKQLRARQQRHRTVNLPGIGETSYRFWGGAGVFLLTAAWWLTPLAPVRVKEREVQDLTIPLGQAIAVAELVMLDGQTAVCLPPVVPEHAKELALLIPETAGSYQLALRAIAEGRFDDADELLAEAHRDGDSKLEQVAVARAQNHMYAGRFLDAVTEYKGALAVQSDAVFILCQAAAACIQAGDLARAEPFVARAGELTGSDSHAEDSERGFYLHVRALLSISQGRRYDEAEKYFKQSRDTWEITLSGSDRLADVSRNNQAIVNFLRARYSAARELIDWSREGRQTPLSSAMALGNLGVLRYVQGDFNGAGTQFESARTAISDGALAVPLPIVAINQSQLALLDWARWNYESGKKHGEAALTHFSESIGPEHPLAAPILVTLATLYRDQSLYAKAESYYFRALGVTRKTYGEQHPYVAAILARLAGLHLARRNHRETELAIGQAIELIEKAFGSEHPALADMLNIQGELELDMGRARDARRPLERALKIVESAYGRSHPSAASILGNLAMIEMSPRTYKRGIVLCDEALAALEVVLGPEHPELARIHFAAATIYLSQGEYTFARPAAEKCLAIREKALVPFHPDVAAACELCATVLEKLPKPETQPAAELRARADAIRQRHAREDRVDAPG